tara:strand:- start:25225 stop:25827 length:603 start_codon:yes stop_codon:yes gene_type:complete
VSEEASEASVEQEEMLTPKEYMLDAQKSTITWIGRKPTGEHRGTLKFLHGALALRPDGAYEGVVESDMNTIECTDIEDKDDNLDLVNHLKDKDFFNVTEFPTSSFQLMDFQDDKDEQSSGMVNGEMMIKGISEHFTIPVIKKVSGDSLMMTGTFIVDRTLYGIKYKSKSIFPELKDKFIDDNVELNFEAWFYEVKPEQSL